MRWMMMIGRMSPYIGLFAGFWVLLLPLAATAELRVSVTRGTVDPMPVALSPFTVAKGQDRVGGRHLDWYGDRIAQVIMADLESTGLFRPIDQKAFITTPASINVSPIFRNWRTVGAQVLIQGQASISKNGGISISFRLWDVFSQKQMLGLSYSSNPENWRRVAHTIADEIYKRLTGEDSGYFDTRIVYIAESGGHERRQKRLAIMDQDGANHRFLTSGKDLVLTPRFSPAAQKITYLSYAGNRPRVHVYHLSTGKKQALDAFPGMTFAPRFSPDGKSIIMSYEERGNSDIYVMDLKTEKKQRLTRHPGIDTSPSYSPDGGRVVFTSDRGGRPNLYVMDADGRNVKRITFGKGQYSTPVWSPRGDLIAFTKISGGRFYIGVISPEGKGERQLASGFLVEGPTWAPNGRVLIFYRQDPTNSDGSGGKTGLFTIDLTGHNEREVITPLDGSDPAWSPLLKFR